MQLKYKNFIIAILIFIIIVVLLSQLFSTNIEGIVAATTKSTATTEPPLPPLIAIQNILESKAPFPLDNLYQWKYDNLPVAKKSKTSPPPPPKPLPFSFQETVNKFVSACIMYQQNHSPMDYKPVEDNSHYYTSYLFELRKNLLQINLKNAADKAKLTDIFSNSLIKYTDNDGTYNVTIDAIIFYCNSHLNFISTIGVINENAPEFKSNFNSDTVNSYGAIQNCSLDILNIFHTVMDASKKTQHCSVIPKSVNALQVLNYADKKNLKKP